MPRVGTLRAFVQQRLTLAAEEIFELFERTIAEYEETLQRQRKPPEPKVKPQVGFSTAGDPRQLAHKEEVPPEQQDENLSLNQDGPPELPCIKEEQGELWTSPQGEQLHQLEEADLSVVTFSPVPVKGEEEVEEKHPCSELHHTEEIEVEADGEECGGAEPDRNFYPDSHLQPLTDDEVSPSSESETDGSGDWGETSKWHPCSKPLRNNEQSESNAGITPLGSAECSPSFGHRSRLQKHSGIQKGLKPFSCSICGKKYAWKNSLANHMRLHAEGKTSSCTVCQKTFPFRAQLVTHMRVHTGERPFLCSVCGTRFTTKGSLREHTKIHTGEKPYRCPVCGKEFAASGNLRPHMRIHTGERPFSCAVCDKSFTQHVTLRKHKCVGEREEKINEAAKMLI